MKYASLFPALLVVLALAACNPIPGNSAYQNRGTPESLLDVSSEVVNLSVASKADTKALADWVAKDKPSHADLFCSPQTPSCKDAKHILDMNHVEVAMNASPNNSVTLVYERILAHDCSSRYIDKWDGWRNASPPSFGCAVAANMVQHVSDKREFINPSLSDDPSAVGAVNAMQRAYAPHATADSKYSVTDSAVKSSGSGGGSQ